MRRHRERQLITWAILGVTSGSTVVASADEAKPPPLPSHVDLCVVGAVLTPSKADGTAWDGTGRLSSQQRKSFDAAMEGVAKLTAVASPPASIAAELLKAFQDPVFAALEKPEVFGSVWVAPDGVFDNKAVLKIPQVASIVPVFGATGVCFKSVKLGSKLSLRVELIDKDLVEDDPIGVVVVHASEIESAVRSGETFPVNVGDQLPGQIKFVTLLATRADPPKPPPPPPAPHKPLKKVKGSKSKAKG